MPTTLRTTTSIKTTTATTTTTSSELFRIRDVDVFDAEAIEAKSESKLSSTTFYFDPEGEYLVKGMATGEVHFLKWPEFDTGPQFQDVHLYSIWRVASNKDYFVTASEDKTVSIFKRSPKILLHKRITEGFPDEVFEVMLNDKNILVVLGKFPQMFVFDGNANWAHIMTLELEGPSNRGVFLDEDHIVIGEGSKVSLIKLNLEKNDSGPRTINSKQARRTVQLEIGSQVTIVIRVRLSYNEYWVGSSDGSILKVNLEAELVQEIYKGTSSVVQLHTFENYLVAGVGGSVLIFDTRRRNGLAKEISTYASRLDFGMYWDIILDTGSYSTISISGQLGNEGSFEEPSYFTQKNVQTIHITDDSYLIIKGSQNGLVTMRKAYSQFHGPNFENAHKNIVWKIASNKDYIVTASEDKSVAIFQRKWNKIRQIKRLGNFSAPVYNVMLNSDDLLLVFGKFHRMQVFDGRQLGQEWAMIFEMPLSGEVWENGAIWINETEVIFGDGSQITVFDINKFSVLEQFEVGEKVSSIASSEIPSDLWIGTQTGTVFRMDLGTGSLSEVVKKAGHLAKQIHQYRDHLLVKWTLEKNVFERVEGPSGPLQGASENDALVASYKISEIDQGAFGERLIDSTADFVVHFDTLFYDDNSDLGFGLTDGERGGVRLDKHFTDW